MKILLTGASGFIGNHVAKILHNKGHKIIATGRKSIDEKKNEWLSKHIYIKADINSSKRNWFKFFKEPDIAIHLAWEGLPDYKNPFHLQNNLVNNYVFLENLLSNGLKSLSVAGTCLEYGMQTGALHEELNTLPSNSYAIAKDLLRRMLEKLQFRHQFSLKWIRLFYTYGHGQARNSILSQLDNAIKNNEDSFNMSGGEQVRDYLPVEKLSEYIEKIACQDNYDGIINCCSGNPITIKNLVKDYLHKNNLSIRLNLGYYPYTDYEPMEFWGDNSKLNLIVNT